MSGNANSTKANVKGRRLGDIVKQGPLSRAEKDLLKACANGEIAKIGAKRPETRTEDESIHASLIRLLALGYDPEFAPVHEKGVRIEGAWIDGDLDLENCRVPVEITLSSCTIPGKVVLRDADCFGLVFNSSEVAEISAQRFHCTTLMLSAGFHATTGAVDLSHGRIDGTLYCNGSKFSRGLQLDGARIGGDLNCTGGCFDGAGGAALYGPGIKIGGFAFLGDGFHANGEVFLPGADIGLNLVCTGGEFKGSGGSDGAALHCSVAKIGGSVYLNGHAPDAGEKDKEKNKEKDKDGEKKNQFRAIGLVRFDEATIAGNVFCGGGLFEGWKTEEAGKVKRGQALNCVQAKVGGSLGLGRQKIAPGTVISFGACGTVCLTGAKIGGFVDCSGGSFNGSEDEGALVLDGVDIGRDLFCSGSRFIATEPGETSKGLVLSGAQASIGGSLFLNSGFHATGGVWFAGAKVGGSLDCDRGHFEAKDHAHALMMEGATVEGDFKFRNVTSKSGLIYLVGLQVAMLVDDLKSWADGRLVLDGFRYDRIAGEHFPDRASGRVERSPVDAKSRIGWLRKQREDDLKIRFKPQPWEQMIKVLRDMGHLEAARDVAIEKQRYVRAAMKVEAGKQTWPRRLVRQTWLRRLVHWLYGITCRYGYRPGSLIVWALGVAVLWASFFAVAGHLGVMGPTDRRILEEVKDAACRPELGGNWTTCATLKRRRYPDFDPIIYSFDLILPVLATQQAKDWTPLTTTPCSAIDRFGVCSDPLRPDVTATTSGYWLCGCFFWLLARFENLLGWLFGLMFVATVSGLVKRD